MKLVVANWKMNPQNAVQAKKLATDIDRGLSKRSRIATVICPPFVFLPAVKPAVSSAKLGSQDLAPHEGIPLTGGISASQLKGFGVSYVIVGHSERRALGETDQQVNQKIRQALKHKIEPVVCVGFGTRKSDSAASIKKVVASQIKKGLIGIPKSRLTIVYEPVWAISRGLGTGTAVEPEHAADIIGFIKKLGSPARGNSGGSLDAKNVGDFAAQKVIQGGLVGGASLQPSEFLKIVKAFEH